MIYETEPELERLHAQPGNNGFVTASAYLKGLHHNDRPTGLMPKDAYILTKARLFYNSLNESDRIVIDSFSDLTLCEEMDLKHRNNRFNELCFLFMMKLRWIEILPPMAEKERKTTNEFD